MEKKISIFATELPTPKVIGIEDILHNFVDS